jgi:hypothetical protein
MVPRPARNHFASGNPFELRKWAGRISKLLSEVRHFVTIVPNSRQDNPLKHHVHASKSLHVKAQGCGLSHQFIRNRRS